MVNRKTVMVSLVMISGLIHVVHAKGVDKDGVSSASTGTSSYRSRYGVEGLLRGHLPALGALSQRDVVNEWKMELLPPRTASHSDDPLTAHDKRVGVTFKLDF